MLADLYFVRNFFAESSGGARQAVCDWPEATCNNGNLAFPLSIPADADDIGPDEYECEVLRANGLPPKVRKYAYLTPKGKGCI